MLLHILKLFKHMRLNNFLHTIFTNIINYFLGAAFIRNIPTMLRL